MGFARVGIRAVVHAGLDVALRMLVWAVLHLSALALQAVVCAAKVPFRIFHPASKESVRLGK